MVWELLMEAYTIFQKKHNIVENFFKVGQDAGCRGTNFWRVPLNSWNNSVFASDSCIYGLSHGSRDRILKLDLNFVTACLRKET